MLAYAANVTGEELPATVAQLKKAQAYAPGRQDLRLDLARLNLRIEDYAAARKLLEPIASQSSEPHIKQEAEMLLARLQNFEEQRSLVETARQQNLATQELVPEETRSTTEVSEAPVMRRKKPTAAPSSGPPEPTLQLHPPRGDKAAGVLARIECLDNGVTFIVKSGGKTLRLYTADPEKILLYKESGDSLGTISMTCGAVSPPSPVVATYRQPATPSASYDGILLSVLFANK